MSIHEFPLFKVGKTNLFQMKDLIEPHQNVTLNVVRNGKVVLSTTVVFARVVEDAERKDLMLITNETTNHVWVSKEEMPNYILEKIMKTANGYDQQYIFHYTI